MSKSYFPPILCYDFHRILCSSMTSAKGGEGGVPQILIFADRGGAGVKKGQKYTDVILEQPLSVHFNNAGTTCIKRFTGTAVDCGS